MNENSRNIVRPSNIGGLPSEGQTHEGIQGEPASKWDWEKALVSRSHAEGMTAGCQHVALLLSTYANGKGASIRPTVETLAAVSGKGQSTIKGSLRYLRDHGWVHQVSRGQTGRASEYRLTIPPRVQ